MIVWTKELDCVIVNGVKRGCSASQIAADLGPAFTRNMVIGRHKRIRGIVTPHEHKLVLRTKQQRIEAARIRAARIRAIHDEMDRLIRKGLDRNFVIVNTRRVGVFFQDIGDHFGITRERVRQICEQEGATARSAV